MKITFYEDRNFGGRSYECSSDCTDMSSYLNRCYSCRVENGCWMVYDQSNFMGNQYFLRRGDYPDYMNMWGWGTNNWIRSCRMIPMYRGSYKMRMYERENFMGQMMDVTDDCDSIMDRYHWSSGCMSCHVMDGHWLMYEHPHYKGRMWYFRPAYPTQGHGEPGVWRMTRGTRQETAWTMCHKSDTLTHYGQYRNVNQPTIHIFGLERNPENLEETPKVLGRTYKLHTQGGVRNRTPNPGGGIRKARTTKPPWESFLAINPACRSQNKHVPKAKIRITC
ncbi:hypothetical protein QTP70_022968, partial [Hemibagrus guttatus]